MKPIIILVITLPLNTDEKDLLFSPLNAIWEKGRWSNSQAAVMIEHQSLSCVCLNDTMTTSYGGSSFINSRSVSNWSLLDVKWWTQLTVMGVEVFSSKSIFSDISRRIYSLIHFFNCFVAVVAILLKRNFRVEKFIIWNIAQIVYFHVTLRRC